MSLCSLQYKERGLPVQALAIGRAGFWKRQRIKTTTRIMKYGIQDWGHYTAWDAKCTDDEETNQFN